MASETIPSERLGIYLDSILIKVVQEYNTWPQWVVKENGGEEQKYQAMEELLRPLCNLSLAVALEGKRVEKKELDLALQQRLARHSRSIFSRITVDRHQVGRSDSVIRLYQSRMMCALTDLIEEDAFLMTQIQKSPLPPFNTVSAKQLFLQADQDRQSDLEGLEAHIGLQDPAINYLGIKDGISRVIDYYESGRVAKTHVQLVGELIEWNPQQGTSIVAAAEGYKLRLRLYNLALRLLPTPAERTKQPNMYQLIMEKLYTHLEVEQSVAEGVAKAIYDVSKKPGEAAFPTILGNHIERMYNSLCEFSASNIDSQRKMSALSQFLAQLPQLVPTIPSSTLSAVFSQLSQKAEQALRGQNSVGVSGPSFSFARLYSQPAYQIARLLFQNYQQVAMQLAGSSGAVGGSAPHYRPLEATMPGIFIDLG